MIPKARGVRLLLISADPLDSKAEVASYLGSLGMQQPSYLKTGDDMAFINGLDPSWDGTLPTSWLFAGGDQRGPGPGLERQGVVPGVDAEDRKPFAAEEAT